MNFKSTPFSTNEFRSPSAVWRGKPFWSWNGKLEAEELIRQIHIIKEMGFGGYFMHSRTGLITEYLGKEWFELTNLCAEEGEKLGLEAWLYDEDRWPSGTAGGMVTANKAYRMKFIHMEKISASDLKAFDEKKRKAIVKAEVGPGKSGEVFDRENTKFLGAWSCRLENEIDCYDLKKLNLSNTALIESLSSTATVLIFRVIPMAEGSFYNGNTYVDTMNREATNEYIKLTHEAYLKNSGIHFGKAIKGIFTDEPHRGAMMSGFSSDGNNEIDPLCLVPYTNVIFDTFADLWSYRIEEILPALFLREEGKAVTPAKGHYVETVMQLFLKNFAKPCYDWCEKNGLLLTGHVLHENTLSCQVSTNGSVQRYYPLMHLPGVDYLGEHGRDYWVVKQIDSTARQFDQPFILSELYGCTGWQFDFEGHKWVGAWQALFGVNVRCHHLSWYTMEGEAKRDYPASILHQSPWYKEYEYVETYFSRFGYFRSQGKPVCQLLVLNPVESLWGRLYPGAIKGMNATDSEIVAIEKKYRELFHILCGNHIDFDYGEEVLLSQHGTILKSPSATVLQLGKMNYTTVLISGVDTMRKSTLAFLKKFNNAGGKVVFAGTPPQYLEWEKSNEVSSFAAECSTCPFDEKEIATVLKKENLTAVSLIDVTSGNTATEIFCQHRIEMSEDKKFQNVEYLTILNTNRSKEFRIEVALSVTKKAPLIVEEWSAETGEGRPIKFNLTSDQIVFETTFVPIGTRFFRICAKENMVTTLLENDKNKLTLTTAFPLAERCAYTLSEQNVCVFDSPQWSFNGEPLEPALEILKLDRTLRKKVGLPYRAGNMVQPWFRGDKVCPPLGKLEMRFELEATNEVLSLLDKSFIAIENANRYAIFINGKGVPITIEKYWIDIAFQKVPLPPRMFKKGKNEIMLQVDFSEDLNLEAFYLVGDFGVYIEEGRLQIRKLPISILPASLVEQGLPFYTGKVSYQYDLPMNYRNREIKVAVPSFTGAYVKVKGATEKMLAWAPYDCNIKTEQFLEIEVCLTRKNVFGPLHLPNPVPSHTGPGHFVTEGKEFSESCTFIPSGLTAPVELLL